MSVDRHGRISVVIFYGEHKRARSAIVAVVLSHMLSCITPQHGIAMVREEGREKEHEAHYISLAQFVRGGSNRGSIDPFFGVISDLLFIPIHVSATKPI